MTVPCNVYPCGLLKYCVSGGEVAAMSGHAAAVHDVAFSPREVATTTNNNNNTNTNTNTNNDDDGDDDGDGDDNGNDNDNDNINDNNDDGFSLRLVQCTQLTDASCVSVCWCLHPTTLQLVSGTSTKLRASLSALRKEVLSFRAPTTSAHY